MLHKVGGGRCVCVDIGQYGYSGGGVCIEDSVCVWRSRVYMMRGGYNVYV